MMIEKNEALMNEFDEELFAADWIAICNESNNTNNAQ